MGHTRCAPPAGVGRRSERTMAVHQGGTAVHATGRSFYGMPTTGGGRTTGKRNGASCRWRAPRRVHHAAGQPGESEPCTALRISQERWAPLPGAEDAWTEELLHAPGHANCATDPS